MAVTCSDQARSKDFYDKGMQKSKVDKYYTFFVFVNRITPLYNR